MLYRAFLFFLGWHHCRRNLQLFGVDIDLELILYAYQFVLVYDFGGLVQEVTILVAEVVVNLDVDGVLRLSVKYFGRVEVFYIENVLSEALSLICLFLQLVFFLRFRLLQLPVHRDQKYYDKTVPFAIY